MAELKYNKDGRLLFTKKMKKEYTILIPMMLPIHFEFIKNIFLSQGYKVELLKNCSYQVVQEGLKYVHNDTCYPALLVIGQMIDALNSGKYDLDRTALIITQTGGGCRASNYIHLLRKALKKAGYEKIPVVSLNLSGMEKNPGFKITLTFLRKAITAVTYGDMLMLLSNQTKAYEINAGDTKQLTDKWISYLTEQLNRGKGISSVHMKQNLQKMADDFDAIPVLRTPKVKVGIVGEIYVKYSALANNDLEEFLASQDCEVMVPGLMNFLIFKVDNRLEDIKLYGGSRIKYRVVEALYAFFAKRERIMLGVLEQHPNFNAPTSYVHLKSLVSGVIGYGAKMGEGWLLTAEMLELIEQGYENIVCTQPFGCLPNHICAKGMIHSVKAKNDKANIVAVDYDPSATKVNQENRIKLMLAVARENMAVKSENHQQETEKSSEVIAV